MCPAQKKARYSIFNASPLSTYCCALFNVCEMFYAARQRLKVGVETGNGDNCSERVIILVK